MFVRIELLGRYIEFGKLKYNDNVPEPSDSQFPMTVYPDYSPGYRMPDEGYSTSKLRKL